MWALILKKFHGCFAWIAAGASFIAMAVVIWFNSKRVGTAKGEAVAAAQTAKEREELAAQKVKELREEINRKHEALKNANQIRSEHASVTRDVIDERLRKYWSRDFPGNSGS